jgi:hypothetical protein
VIVYMSRKQRRPLQEHTRHGRVRGNSSSTTLREALASAQQYMQFALEELPDCDCNHSGSECAEEYLECALIVVDDLVAAHTRRRWFPRKQSRKEAVPPYQSAARLEAVEAAMAFVSLGGAERVKAALAMVGCQRVSEMPDADVPAFLAALG